MAARRRIRPGWIAVGLVLIAFGCLAIFSIGLPILVAGALVLVAGLTDAHRERPDAFWPLAAGMGALFVGYVLVAPLSCTSRAEAVVDGQPVGDQPVGATACTNLLGIDYSGGPGYDPPLWPAGAAAAGSAFVAGAASRRLMAGRQKGAG